MRNYLPVTAQYTVMASIKPLYNYTTLYKLGTSESKAGRLYPTDSKRFVVMFPCYVYLSLGQNHTRKNTLVINRPSPSYVSMVYAYLTMLQLVAIKKDRTSVINTFTRPVSFIASTMTGNRSHTFLMGSC